MLVEVVAEITNPMGCTHTEVWSVEMHDDDAPDTIPVRYVWGVDEMPKGYRLR